MATEKCSSEEMDAGPPSPMTIDSISQMIYRKAMMDEQTSHEPITIFYDGRIYVFDVMELKVRAIILFGAREMEGGMTSSSCKEAISLALVSQIVLGPPNCGSVKKSLRTFLQKRKNQASDPYSCSSS